MALTDGETEKSFSKSRVIPSTPPSVTPEKEWMLNKPKARIALPKRQTRQFFGFNAENKISQPFPTIIHYLKYSVNRGRFCRMGNALVGNDYMSFRKNIGMMKHGTA